MADSTVIQEFLVSLGFKLDDSQRARFDAALSSNRASAEGLNSTLAQVGKQLGILGDQLLKVSGNPTREAENAADRISKRHALLQANVKQLGLTAVTTTAAFTTGFFEIAKQYEQLYYVSQRTGVSAQQLAATHFAGPQVGLGAGEIQGAIEAITTAARNPGIKAFIESWGVASNDLEGIIAHLKQLPVVEQDAFANLIHLPQNVMRALINNPEWVQAIADFKRRSEDALGRDGFNRLVDEAKQSSNDLAKIWSQIGLIGAQGFREIYPVIHSVLGQAENLLEVTTKWNASHPGEALKESLAAAYVSTVGFLAAAAKFGIGPGAGFLGRALPPLAIGGGLGVLGMGINPVPRQAPSAAEAANRWNENGWTPPPGYQPPLARFKHWLGFTEGGQEGKTVPIPPHYADGGIVPINAHAGEIVLPQSLSAMLLQAAQAGGSGSGDLATYVEVFRSWLGGNMAYHPVVQVLGLDTVALNSMAYGVGSGLGGGGGPGGGGAGSRGRGGRGGPGAGVAGDVSDLKLAPGNATDATASTIAQAAAKLGVTDPKKIAIAQAAYLSAFDYESHLQPGIRIGQHVDANGKIVGTPTGSDVNIAQWTGDRRKHMQGYGPEDSLEAGQKQLYHELTQDPTFRKQFLSALSGDPNAAISAANQFETGGATFAPGIVTGHGARFNKFLGMMTGRGDVSNKWLNHNAPVPTLAHPNGPPVVWTNDPPKSPLTDEDIGAVHRGTDRSLFPPGTKFNSKGQPYNLDMTEQERANQAASYAFIKAHPTSWLGGKTTGAEGGGGDRHTELTHNPSITIHGSSSDMDKKVIAALNSYSGRFLRNARAVIT